MERETPMAVLDIKRYPERVLREKALPVDDIGPSTQRIIDDMIETMYSAEGVGLAANQVGILKRIIVVDVSARGDRAPLIVLINPELIHTEGESVSEEGCLSLPGYRTAVKRAEKVKVRGLDRYGKEIEIEGNGLLSRALQHEIDHLNGMLIIDRIGRLKKELFRKRYLKGIRDGKRE